MCIKEVGDVSGKEDEPAPHSEVPQLAAERECSYGGGSEVDQFAEANQVQAAGKLFLPDAETQRRLRKS